MLEHFSTIHLHTGKITIIIIIIKLLYFSLQLEYFLYVNLERIASWWRRLNYLKTAKNGENRVRTETKIIPKMQ